VEMSFDLESEAFATNTQLCGIEVVMYSLQADLTDNLLIQSFITQSITAGVHGVSSRKCQLEAVE